MAQQKRVYNGLSVSLDTSPIRAKLADFPTKVAKVIGRGALRHGLAPTRVAAMRYAPVRTGALAGNIKIRGGKTSGMLVSVLLSSLDRRMSIKGLSPKTFYGLFQEKGWKARNGRVIPGKHYMQRAFDDTEAEFERRVDEFVDEGVKQYMGTP